MCESHCGILVLMTAQRMEVPLHRDSSDPRLHQKDKPDQSEPTVMQQQVPSRYPQRDIYTR